MTVVVPLSRSWIITDCINPPCIVVKLSVTALAMLTFAIASAALYGFGSVNPSLPTVYFIRKRLHIVLPSVQFGTVMLQLVDDWSGGVVLESFIASSSVTETTPLPSAPSPPTTFIGSPQFVPPSLEMRIQSLPVAQVLNQVPVLVAAY